MTKEIPAVPTINHNDLQIISNTKDAVIFFPRSITSSLLFHFHSFQCLLPLPKVKIKAELISFEEMCIYIYIYISFFYPRVKFIL